MAYRGNVDFISNIPSEIIEMILTHLKPHQAVQTSVLARSWRYRWTTMPELNFGDMSGGWGTVAKVVKGVNGCLDLHQGPIRKFSIRSNTLTVRNKIYHWMCLVLKPDLEDLQVEVDGGGIRFPFHEGIRFPFHLFFNCKKLTRLRLSGIELNVPSTFEGFLNLKMLDLFYEMVDSKIRMLISKSPFLENLELYSRKRSNDMITISIPRVKYFKLQGEFKDICLENATVLVDMRILLSSNGGQCNVIKLIGGAPNLERLTIHYFTENFRYGFSWGILSVSTTFNYLKLMKLVDVHLDYKEGIPVLLEFITSAPNLEKLVIMPRQGYGSKPKLKADCWEKEYSPRNGFMKLKVVEMLNILCVTYEIAFITFMLHNSPILEKMELRSSQRSGAIIKRMNKKLPKLPRASVRAEVTFHPDDWLWYSRFEN